MSRLRLSFFLGFVILFLGCDGLSPTEPATPTPTPFNGRFSGNLGIRAPVGEDWTFATLDLRQNGNSITGTVRDRNGKAHDLEGSIWFDAGARGSVEVKNIESPACFEIGISFLEVEYDRRTGNARALIGQVGGRCHGTVMHSFRLTRE